MSNELPKFPNFVSPELAANDILLQEGMVIAIEPMVNLGGCEVDLAADRWTVVTRDGRLSAHCEQTVAIGPDGAEVLTAS